MSDPVIANLTWWKNAKFSQTFQFVDSNGLPISLAGSTFDMDIKAAPGTGSAVLTPTLDVSNIASGIIGISWLKDALPVGVYVYDLIQLTGGVVVDILMQGSVTMLEGVTQ